MAALSHQSAINLDSNYWVSTNSSAEQVIAPFIIHTHTNSNDMVLDVPTSNTATITVSSAGGQIELVASPNQVNLNVGNLLPALSATTTGVAVQGVPFNVDDPNGTTQSVTIQTLNTGGRIFTSTGLFEIGSNTSFNDGQGLSFSLNNQVGALTSNASLFSSNNVITGGIATNGTGITLGTTSNFSNLPGASILIPSTGEVQIRKGELYVNDPVTSANFVKITDVAGEGYVDLVANAGLLYPQLKFQSNALNLQPLNIYQTNGANQTRLFNGNQLNFINAANTSGAGIYMDPVGGQLVINQGNGGGDAGRIVFTNAAGQPINVNSNGIVDFNFGITVQSCNVNAQLIQQIGAVNVPTQVAQRTIAPASSATVTDLFSVNSNTVYRLTLQLSGANGDTNITTTQLKLEGNPLQFNTVGIATLFNPFLTAGNGYMEGAYSCTFTPVSNALCQIVASNTSLVNSTVLSFPQQEIFLEKLSNI